MKNEPKKETMHLKKEKDLLVKMRKTRLLNSISSDTELEAILGSKANIYKEAYHDDDLNVICCINLLGKQKEVVTSIKKCA